MSAARRRIEQSRTQCQPPDRGQSSEPARHSASARTWKNDELARIHSIAHGGLGFGRLFHGRSVDGWRIDDLLRAEFYASGFSESVPCRDNDFAEPAVDGTDGTQRDAGGGRFSLW